MTNRAINILVRNAKALRRCARSEQSLASIENFAGPVGDLRWQKNVAINLGQGRIVEGDGPEPISGVQFVNNTVVDVLQEAVILKHARTVSVRSNIFYDVGHGADNYLAADSSASDFAAAATDMYMSDGARPGEYGNRRRAAGRPIRAPISRTDRDGRGLAW